MTKERLFRITALLLALLGLVVLWQGTVWGIQAVPAVMRQLGTVSGDLQHQIVYEGPVTALRVTGALLFGIGLWRVLEPPTRIENGR